MTTIQTQLPPRAVQALNRPVVGRGGFQALLRGMQRQLGTDGALTLTLDMVERIGRYVERYGEGGFQGRLEHVLNELRTLAGALRSLIDEEE